MPGRKRGKVALVASAAGFAFKNRQAIMKAVNGVRGKVQGKRRR